MEKEEITIKKTNGKEYTKDRVCKQEEKQTEGFKKLSVRRKGKKAMWIENED